MPTIYTSGEDLTLTDLYDMFEDSLSRYAQSLVQDPHRADDLVQETFIRAIAHLGLLGGLNRHQRKAWLCRVLKNLFLDEQRALKREQALIQQLIMEAQVIGDPYPRLLSHEWRELVPKRDRELLHQRYTLMMTSEEIGRQLGIPAATVRSRLHLAIKRLRAHRSDFF